uniref:arabinan endo-1,5-alpha-L-arabinosidase n=1 Tax=Phytophthora ramorum TaxID=164328 RepID=H3G9G1_PHYRM
MYYDTCTMFRTLGRFTIYVLPSDMTGAYVNPGACSGTCVNTHDPSIIRREDGTYFRFSTGGGIAVHSAPDITGPWTFKGSVLPEGTSIKLWDGDMDVWAPDVHLVGDTYYLYYSAVRALAFDGHNLAAVGVATSTSMDIGTWKDLGSTGVESNDSSEYNAIDPDLFVEDGRNYMIFGSYEDGLFQVLMADPPTSAVPDTYAKLAYEPAGIHADEGANMFKNGDYNYLFYSNGVCCGFDKTKPAAGEEYKIKVCRSKTGVMDFRDADGKLCTEGGGVIVLESHDNVYGPGGQGVYDDPTYGPILYYHYVDTTIGYADGQKQFGWNKLDFSSGWPVTTSAGATQ